MNTLLALPNLIKLCWVIVIAALVWAFVEAPVPMLVLTGLATVTTAALILMRFHLG